MKNQRSKKKKKTFDLGDEYRRSWKYVVESRNFIFIIIGIFLVFSLIGFFIRPPEEIEAWIIDTIRELIEKTQGMSGIELIQFIFFNNLLSSFSGIALGIFLGTMPVFSAIVNGYILGYVASASVKTAGAGILWRLFPHGIFELPAVFISFGLGLRLGIFIFQKKKMSFKYHIINSLKVFLLIVVPLLVIAAIIEGTLISLE